VYVVNCDAAVIEAGKGADVKQLSVQSESQSLIDYLGNYLQVTYRRRDVLLTNSGPRDIPPDVRWTIYFNHIDVYGEP